MPKKTRKIGIYDSKMEKILHEGVLKDLEFHPKPGIGYYIPARNAIYEPDFKLSDKVYYECKGRFRTREEANKYLLVRESNPDITIYFILYDPDKPFPGSKPRKDGTRLSHSEWCDKNNFIWYSFEFIKNLKFSGDFTKDFLGDFTKNE